MMVNLSTWLTIKPGNCMHCCDSWRLKTNMHSFSTLLQAVMEKSEDDDTKRNQITNALSKLIGTVGEYTPLASLPVLAGPRPVWTNHRLKRTWAINVLQQSTTPTRDPYLFISFPENTPANKAAAAEGANSWESQALSQLALGQLGSSQNNVVIPFEEPASAKSETCPSLT